MFPMVQSVEELERARGVLSECAAELTTEGIPFGSVKIGVMIEIPAAALIARELAARCDFFSIGTNDLTQYTLAIDRGNEALATLYDPLHPAVQRLIQLTIEAAHERGIPCGMCGELAGDTRASELLASYGLDEFSMASASIAEVQEILMR
jgi:phosphotransferase system enzyme I (PtsI)